MPSKRQAFSGTPTKKKNQSSKNKLRKKTQLKQDRLMTILCLRSIQKLICSFMPAENRIRSLKPDLCTF